MLSYWEKDIFKKKYDFIIVGAGFSGLWLTYFIKKLKPLASIAILEKGVLPSGASTKNAGFACFGSPTELLENIKLMGLEQALGWTKKRYEGIEIIKNHFGNLVDYNGCGASELFSSKHDFETCNDQLSILNKNLSSILENKEHFFVDNTICATSGFKNFNQAVSNNSEAAIHPGKLHYELYKSLVALEVKFFFGTEVLKFEQTHQGVTLNTKELGEFTTSQLIICTNAFSNNLLPDQKIKPGRGQVLITSPIRNLKFNTTFHFDKGYFYFRNVGNRVLIGGGRNLDFEGESTQEFGENAIIRNELELLLKQNILPNSDFKIETNWSGIMAFNESKIPFSNRINDCVSACVAMNGMGVALAPTLGKELATKLVE